MRSFPTYQRYDRTQTGLYLNVQHAPLHLLVLLNRKASEEPEERETLALMAARGDTEETQDGETYIEKYTRGVLEVENILSLERLRQVSYRAVIYKALITESE